MSVKVARPQVWHERRHPGPIEDCWYCQRARAHCRAKIRFGSWREAADWVRDFNESHRYAEAVTRYPCRWCDGWHLTKVTTKIATKRTEKQRRKWLVEQRSEVG